MLSPRDNANAQFVAIKYIRGLLTNSGINEFGSILTSLQAMEGKGEVPEEKSEEKPTPRQKRKLNWQLGDEDDLKLINIHVRNKFLSILNTTSAQETKKMAHSCLIILSRYWPMNSFETEDGGNYPMPICALTLGTIPENAWIVGSEGRLYDAVNANNLIDKNADPVSRNPFHPMDIDFMQMKIAGDSKMEFTKQYFKKSNLQAVWRSFSSTGRFRFIGHLSYIPMILLSLSSFFCAASGIFWPIAFFLFSASPLFSCLVFAGVLFMPAIVGIVGVLIGAAGSLLKDAYYLVFDKNLTCAAMTMQFLNQIKAQAVLSENSNPWFIENAETIQIKIALVILNQNEMAPSESSKPLDFFSPKLTSSTPLLADDTPAPGVG